MNQILNNNLLLILSEFFNLQLHKKFRLINKDFYDLLQSIQSLKYLDFKLKYKFTIIPDSYLNISSLLKCNNLEKKYFAKLSNINKLCINSEVDDIVISKLTNLIELNCDENDLISDDGVINLIKLKILNCGDNTKLTNNILFKLTNLEKIYYNSNNKININEEILSKLSHLKVIDYKIKKKIIEDNIKNDTNIFNE